MGFKFEQLRIWESALKMTVDIHNLTSKFPKEELFILTSQIKRAADSICLNIAEGSTGQSNPEQAKFLGYALRSGIEVITCLYIAKERDLIDEKAFKIYYDKIEKLIISIQAMRKALKDK